MTTRTTSGSRLTPEMLDRLKKASDYHRARKAVHKAASEYVIASMTPGDAWREKLDELEAAVLRYSAGKATHRCG